MERGFYGLACWGFLFLRVQWKEVFLNCQESNCGQTGIIVVPTLFGVSASYRVDDGGDVGFVLKLLKWHIQSRGECV